MKGLTLPQATSEQLKIIGDTKLGIEVIRGAAGSGKTTTALLRLKNLSLIFSRRFERENLPGPIKVLVLTFNRTLSGYIEALARSQTRQEQNIDLQIETFAKWSINNLEPLNIIPDNQRNQQLRGLQQKHGLESFSLEFLKAERDYVRGRFVPAELHHYIEAERTGRGQTPRVDRAARQKILDLIAEETSINVGNMVCDWPDLPLLMQHLPTLGYQVIIVDEGQDFSAIELRAVRHHLDTQFSFVVIKDSVQQLYPRGFLWREAGIDATSGMVRFHRLATNHRNTKQIATFAKEILNGLSLDDDGTMPDLQAAQTIGPLPIVLIGQYSEQADYAISHINSSIDLTSESVAFLKPKGGNWFRFLKQKLGEAGLTYEEVSAERDWPISDTNICLSTMHSAKGLEFDHVIILGLNSQIVTILDDNEDSANTLRRLIAMAVARARKSVIIGYKEPEQSNLVSYFKAGTFRETRL
jgi:DNA helicase IV